MKNRWLIMLVFLFLSSCAYGPQWEWQHEYRSAEERDADYDFCRKAANKNAWGGGFLTSPAEFHLFQEEKDAEKVRCMQGLGYTAVRVER